MAVTSSTRRLVWERAGSRCEYCRMRQEWEPLHVYHVEHIVARQHRGTDTDENLALACHKCNFRKGPNLGSMDPDGDRHVRLFHPRLQVWDEHFVMLNGFISGRSDVGRTTVFLMEMNEPHRFDLRLINLMDW